MQKHPNNKRVQRLLWRSAISIPQILSSASKHHFRENELFCYHIVLKWVGHVRFAHSYIQFNRRFFSFGNIAMHAKCSCTRRRPNLVRCDRTEHIQTTYERRLYKLRIQYPSLCTIIVDGTVSFVLPLSPSCSSCSCMPLIKPISNLNHFRAIPLSFNDDRGSRKPI